MNENFKNELTREEKAKRNPLFAGIPITFRRLEQFLNENGVYVIGIEEDIGGKRRFQWILGRKRFADKSTSG